MRKVLMLVPAVAGGWFFVSAFTYALQHGVYPLAAFLVDGFFALCVWGVLFCVLQAVILAVSPTARAERDRQHVLQESAWRATIIQHYRDTVGNPLAIPSEDFIYRRMMALRAARGVAERPLTTGVAIGVLSTMISNHHRHDSV